MNDVADKILALVALHPWIDTSQIAALAGCSRQWAGQRLGQLAAAGMVQSCQVFGLCTTGNLYALAARGYREAQVPGYVTRGFVTGALLQVEALWGTRNLLVRLAQRGNLLASASPIRERSQDARGKALVLNLAAMGIAIKDHRHIPFVVVWDLGEIIVKAFEPTFVRLYRWSRSEVYRNHPARFPATVVVTINQRRAWQLVEMWHRVASHCRLAPLPCYVGVWEEIISSDRDGAWCKVDNESARVPLFHSLSGLDRAPTLFTTARRTKSSTTDYRSVLVSLHLGVPDQRSRQVLRSVASWPLLTAKELALMAGEHLRSIQASLKSLMDLGLIKSHLIESNLGYYLASAGIQLLAAACGQSPVRYAQSRHWSIVGGGQGRLPRLNLLSLVRSPAHTRQVRAFFVSLARLAEHCRRDLALDHTLVAWDDERESRRYFRFGGRRWTLAPDASGLYRIGDQLYEFFLEIDRGTESRPRLARKLSNYYTYWKSGEFRREGSSMPRLLIVVPDEGRARAMRAVIVDGASLYGCDPLPAWIAVKEALDSRGPGAPVWRELTRWRFEHCLEGFGSPPESARMQLDLLAMRTEVERDARRKGKGTRRSGDRVAR